MVVIRENMDANMWFTNEKYGVSGKKIKNLLMRKTETTIDESISKNYRTDLCMCVTFLNSTITWIELTNSIFIQLVIANIGTWNISTDHERKDPLIQLYKAN